MRRANETPGIDEGRRQVHVMYGSFMLHLRSNVDFFCPLHPWAVNQHLGVSVSSVLTEGLEPHSFCLGNTAEWAIVM